MREIILNNARVPKSRWNYKKFFIETIEMDLVDLDVVTGYGNNPTANVFWAVDEIRICNRVGGYNTIDV